MELTNSVILSPHFIPAVEKLLTVEIDVRDCIALSEAIDKVNIKLAALEKTKKGLVERFAKKDEKGEVVTQPASDNPNLRYPLFDSEENAKGFAEAIGVMLEEPYTFPLSEKIKINGSLKLTTDEFRLIKSIIEVVS